MTCATPTNTTIAVIPLSELVVEHTHKCLFRHQGMITESPVPCVVKYPIGMPIELQVVLDGDNAKYVDRNGWMFSDAVIERLVRKRKIRYAM